METTRRERVISPQANNEEKATTWENRLRPQSFGDFPGQQKVISKLRVFVEAAKGRNEPLDHTLFCGPPGLGKTTLSQIMAHELGVTCLTTSGPALDNKGKLAALLTSLQPYSILFIDEIHRLNRVVEEYLYSAMEDYYIDLVTGEGLGAHAMKFQLAPFTLVGATTREGLLNAPLRGRFGIVDRLSFYERSDLVTILMRSASLLEIELLEEGAVEIARRSRGTPRVANRLLKRVRDYAQVKGDGRITADLSAFALDQLEVDQMGLDEMDRQILRLIDEKFSGGPVGIDTLAAALNEERGTLEEVYEPYLLQEGLLQRTPRGRVITEQSRAHLQSMI